MISLLVVSVVAAVVLYALTRVAGKLDVGYVSQQWLNNHHGTEGSQDYWLNSKTR